MHVMQAHPLGRLTLPSQPITDKHFVYTKADHTDVTRTMQRARERMVNEALQAELQAIAQQALLPGVIPVHTTVQRLRAGIRSVISLPTL